MQENLDNGDIVRDMVIMIANPNDEIDNATIMREGEHKTITAAKLKVTSIAYEQDGQCDDINYDPLFSQTNLHHQLTPC